jgi:hypothetical protein
MNRKHERDDLIELGAASVGTRGSTWSKDDQFAGLIPVEGLSDD